MKKRNRWKESALILAASKGFREIAELLIQYGADISAEDANKKTATAESSSKWTSFCG